MVVRWRSLKEHVAQVSRLWLGQDLNVFVRVSRTVPLLVLLLILLKLLLFLQLVKLLPLHLLVVASLSLHLHLLVPLKYLPRPEQVRHLRQVKQMRQLQFQSRRGVPMRLWSLSLLRLLSLSPSSLLLSIELFRSILLLPYLRYFLFFFFYFVLKVWRHPLHFPSICLILSMRILFFNFKKIFLAFLISNICIIITQLGF
uniref:Uncharacterized protein n=1 Tax=Brassica oleracea var. oleracea TaxID=109376 RepID=A0A0D3BDM4_BRAOL